MVTYMSIPQNRVTVGATTYDNTALSGKITRLENGFDIATLVFEDQYSAKRSVLVAGAPTIINIKDSSDGSYTNILSGVARYRIEGIDPEAIILKCESMGFPLAECLVGQEYGAQSNNPTLDTLKEILTDGTAGIIDKWVEKVLNTAVNSQYAFDTTYIDTITGTINYLYFPFKPASKCLADICNIVQAIKGATAGPHWIVTTDGATNYLRVKLVDGTQTGWTKYYGNSQANATLTQGIDFLKFNAETLTSEANYILYHGNWIYPTDMDYATETGTWDTTTGDGHPELSYSTSIYKKGIKSLKVIMHTAYPIWWYPSTINLGLDLTKCGGTFNVPTLNIWLRRNATFTMSSIDSFIIYAWSHTNPPYTDAWFQIWIDLPALLPAENKWQQLSIPIGPHWKEVANNPIIAQGWSAMETAVGSDWENINAFKFYIDGNPPNNSELYLDGLFLGGWVLRGAYNSTLIATNGLKTRIINDQFCKDDTLKVSDDSGTIARLAYAELLRAQTTPTVGTLTVPMIKDLLPGQLVHIHARPNSAGTFQVNSDFRVTQLIQRWQANEYLTDLSVTSDVTNSYARAAYDSINEVNKNTRPEFQDRQATGMKMREIDITQSILAKDYG